MPLITDTTAIKVVVARMIPSSVRKLRSLLARKLAAAPTTASQNEACDPMGVRSGPDSTHTRAYSIGSSGGEDRLPAGPPASPGDRADPSAGAPKPTDPER